MNPSLSLTLTLPLSHFLSLSLGLSLSLSLSLSLFFTCFLSRFPLCLSLSLSLLFLSLFLFPPHFCQCPLSFLSPPPLSLLPPLTNRICCNHSYVSYRHILPHIRSLLIPALS